MKGKFGIFLGAGFLVLSTIAAATGNFAVRLDLASQQAQPQQAQQASIGIQRITLTQSAPGTPFNIYFEPTNLATRFENGNVRASMSVDVLVRNAQGQTVVSRDNLWQLPLARPSTAAASLTQVYGDLTVNRLDLAEGRYQLVLRIHDDFNGTFVDRTLDIDLRRAPVTPGPRLSQSTQTPRTR